MKLRTRILLLFLGILIFFVASITFIGQLYTQKLNSLFDEESAASRYQFEQFVSLNDAGSKSLADDFSYWDDMVNFIKTGDQTFAHQNIDTALGTFASEGAWVFKPDQQEVYKIVDPSSAAMADIKFPPEVFSQLNRFHYTHFFINSPSNELVEIEAYTVHPTADSPRKTTPQGYFMVGNLWDKNYLDKLSKQLNASIQLAENGLTAVQIKSTKDDATITFDEPLKDSNGQVTKYAIVRVDSDLLKKLVNLIITIFVLALAFGVASAIAVTVAIGLWVIKPVRILGRSLAMVDPEIVQPLANSKAEFGGLARFLIQFFEQQKLLDQANLESNRLRQLSDTYLKSIGDGIVAIDRNWNIILINPAAEKITGWPAAEAIGKPLREILKFIKKNDRSENINFIEDAMVKGQISGITEPTLLITKAAKEVPVGDSASPIVGSDGRVTGAIIVFRDDTKAQEAKQIHSDFAYMSHQLRTPVTEAMWALENSLEETDPLKAAEQTHTAYSSLKSVQRLADQLIIVSDIDQQTIIPKIETVKLGDLLKELIEKAKPEAEQIKANIVLQISPETLELASDRKLLSRVITEVLSNSIHYSNPDNTIKLNVSNSEKGTLIQISDAGIGIKQEELPLIFTRFFRGSNFDKGQLPGAGLGLFITKGLVDLLGGKVWFSAAENMGMEFSILLPPSGQKSG